MAWCIYPSLSFSLTSFKIAGVNTSPATSKNLVTRLSVGKLSSTHSLCFCAWESPGVHNFSPRLSWVNLTKPTKHAPTTRSEIRMVIHGLPPTAFPSLRNTGLIKKYLSLIWQNDKYLEPMQITIVYKVVLSKSIIRNQTKNPAHPIKNRSLDRLWSGFDHQTQSDWTFWQVWHPNTT